MPSDIRRSSTLIAILASALLAAGCAGSSAPSSPSPAPASKPSVSKVTMTTEKTIALPGAGGHGDVVLADPAEHAVYVAQSPRNNLVVIDTNSNTVAAVIPGIANANGIVFSDSYVFVAEADAGAVAVIARPNWHLVATVPSGGKEPDAVYYDQHNNSVFVANVGSNNMEEFSATPPFAVTGVLPLQPSPAKSGPDLGTYSPADDRIYQADDNDVAVIDPNTRTIQKVIPLPLPPDAAAKDMYYDQARRLLWIATSKPEVIALNPSTGAVSATVKTAGGGDEVAADPGRGLLFVGESVGVIGVIDMAAQRNVADIKTERNFHTLDYLPGANLVYAYLNDSNKVDVDRVDTAP